MRILQLAQKPQQRGAEVFAAQLTDELLRRGHEAQLAFLYPAEQRKGAPLDPAHLVLDGVEHHRLETLLGADPRLLRRLHRLVRMFRPDVVQLNGARTVKYGALLRACGLDEGSRVVYRNIGDPRTWVRGFRRQIFYRCVMRNVDGVVAVSEDALATLRSTYRIRVPATVIPTGVDVHRLRPRKSRADMRALMRVPKGAPVLLFVGSLSREKRVDRVLETVRSVSDHVADLRLWIVGDGPERFALEAQAHALGLTGSVTFVGTCEDVASYMAAADVLMLLSDTEGIPAVLLEAAYLGLPAVATLVGGIRECVLDGETGLLVPPNDASAVEAALIRLLMSVDLRQTMGERASALVRERFTMGRIAGEYLDFYETLERSASITSLTADEPAASPVL